MSRCYSLSVLALAAGLGLGFPLAGASEDHGPKPTAKATKAAKETEPAADEHSAPSPKSIKPSLRAEAEKGHGAAPAALPAATEGDSMDKLRSKLAERLGATKAPDSRSPNVLRVVNKAPDGHGPSVTVAPRAGAAKAAGLSPAEARAATEAHHSPHWSYQGEWGPAAWGAIKPEFNLCAAGKRQSPIDIRSGIQVQLPAIQFDYRLSGFTVLDNGHTVQANLGSGNAITVLGRRYDLLQFHFHRPSEERVNGRQYDMVVHLVHKDPEGRLAVIAVLLERGNAHPLIQAVWNALPLEKGEEVAAPVSIDLMQLLPEDKRYYTYMGSLTTPPCSEGVLWMVMKQPVQLASEQIDIFARLYPMNARPIQPNSGRLIKDGL